MSFKAYDIDALSVSDILLDKEIDIDSVIKKTEYENIDILPSNISLAFTEKKILLDVTRNQQNRLKRVLDKIEDKYDYCIIDCPPSLNMITINALVASDEVIVPIKIDKFALDGLEYLLESIDEIKEEFNPNLQFKGCFVTMVQQQL
ncbi:cobQ/CobB/MinD/ParA nucleotide binding domain protein [[Clostridium] sordellii ATCC 9714]|nr:cobQ/CobB/MinD/ParA nucleotide binding domain protein [[Clostridium] sordellii ATCC 9714] [Paeniclostridium sordellii ATCC 9714]